MDFDLRDKPIDSIETDLLDTYSYAKAISTFILQSSLPVTISIQGEWGSGKTSLMKMIEKNVCDEYEDKYFESLWINTWEFFVNNNSNNACEQIILYILREITKHTKEKSTATNNSGIDVEGLKKNVKHYLSSIANITMDIAGVSDETKKSTIDIFSDIRLTTAAQLRKSVESTIDKLVCQENGLSNAGYIFFIDDLDRIDAENAIRILDILKNIFDISHCVFVLAVDSDVITRGLQKKYGDFDEKNQAAYRAYFDKLIQLPFTVPSKTYNSTKIVKWSLTKIDYFKGEFVDESTYQKLSQVVNLAIHNNPRSLKRVANSLLLSDIIDGLNKKVLVSLENRLINFVFVTIQIGYPEVYSYMLSFPNLLAAYLCGEEKTFKELIYSNLEESVGVKKLNEVEEVFVTLKNLADDFSDSGEIILLSATTNMAEGIDPKVHYDGYQYDKSSQTQFKQGKNLIEKISLQPNWDVLDIGCGNGKTTIELYRLEPSVTIKAFDYSESQIEVARDNREKAGTSEKAIRFYQLDALDFNEKDAYDLVFSNASLHWLQDGKGIYSKIYQALKAGGSIAVHQGGKDSYRELHEMARLAANELGIGSYFKDWICPLFYPTKKEMENILSAIGFSNIEVISEESQGREYDRLIDNFANASLIPYLQRCKTQKEREKLIQGFKRLSEEKVESVYTHRLYIFADKVD
ncbi:MAG TPA: hypothetical protein DHN33_01325 [Eubacteriaceae bacterium]|nr:hypothetical protein [Eubacteriaceae bacterium]